MLFVALEGIDGSGKGTQARLLSSWLRDKGYPCHLTAEPTTGEVGKVIRGHLQEDFDSRALALLFAADRALHLREIMPRLERGEMVISERYLYSSLAYQGALGLDLQWLRSINSFAPGADMVFYLDLEPGVALERITSLNSFRRERKKESYEREDFLARVREIYLQLAQEEENFEVVDAHRKIGEVQTELRRKLGRTLSFMEEERGKGKQTRLGELR